MLPQTEKGEEKGRKMTCYNCEWRQKGWKGYIYCPLWHMITDLNFRCKYYSKESSKVMGFMIFIECGGGQLPTKQEREARLLETEVEI